MLQLASPPRLGYRAHLDGLRAIAVTLVVVDHAQARILRGGGWVGVAIFFALSGFLITKLLLEEWDAFGRIRLSAFYLRRARRLLPALATLLVTFVLASWFIGDPRLRQGAAWAALYVANFVPGTSLGLFNHTWSLAVEEHFYVAWPLLLGAVLRSSKNGAALWYVLALAALSAVWRYSLVLHGSDYERVHRFTDGRLESLLAGCAAAIWFHGGGALPSRPVVVPLLAAIAGCAFLDPARQQWVGAVGISVVAWGTSIVLLHFMGSVPSLLTQPAMVGIGKISYGIYLWHFPMLRLMRRVLPGALGASAAIVATLGLATVSWYLIERRFLVRRHQGPSQHFAPARQAAVDREIL